MDQATYISRHYERLLCMNGISATYRLPDPDDAQQTLELAVTIAPAQTRGERAGDELTIDSHISDVLIAAEDLVHNGALIVPDETHRVIVPATQSWADDLELRPLPPTDGAPLWRWSDPQRTILRIHTREVSPS